MGLVTSGWWGNAVVAVMLLGAALGCRPTPPAVDTASLSDTEKERLIDEMYGGYREEFAEVEEIGAEELARLLEDESVVLVDVREDRERAVSMIAGAISTREFEERMDELAGRPIVLHCTIGYRSGKYAQDLEEKGIHARNLAGSILSWVHAGQPVVDAQGVETKRVHVYGETWDLLPAGYTSVW